MNSRRFSYSAIAGALAFLTVGCQGEEEALPIYQMLPVSTRDIIVSASAAGTVEPVRTVEVKSKASGEILEVRVGSLSAQLLETSPRRDHLPDEVHQVVQST